MAGHHFDSRRWAAIRLRAGDIVISSWAKSGTTWLQQIACQLVHDGSDDIEVNRISPWVDFRLTPITDIVDELEGQRFRRVMKSHLPADAIPLLPMATYLYIARHPLDVVWSWFCHHHNFTDETYRRLNETPGRIGPALERPDPDFGAYLHRWLREDGYPFHPYWSNVASWWTARERRNVALFHFADLRNDLAAGVRRVADILDIRVQDAAWPRILAHCSFRYMRDRSESIVPFRGAIFKGGAPSFLRSGKPRQWQSSIGVGEIEACRAAAAGVLETECVEWLFRHGA